MRDNDPLVSVAVITYGHEKYIQKALDSILMQKVNFDYEIIVGEDCSPDKTREILEEYEYRYESKFIMIYRDQNVGGHSNERDVLKRCRGKYIAFLEGDDYWTSNLKLQRQIDYLEYHKKCIATFHRVEVVDERGNKTIERYPECLDSFYTYSHFKRGLLPGQSGSMVCRNIYNDSKYDLSILEDITLVPSDRVQIFVLAMYGDIYCFSDIMSAYRHVTTGGSSYSATKVKKMQSLKKISYYHSIMKYAQISNVNEESIKTAEILYFWVVVRSLGNRDVSFEVALKAISKMHYLGSAILFAAFQIMSWPVRHFILKHEGRI